MNLITKEELNAIKMRIQKEFKNDDVEFSGCNRFVMREGYQTKVVGGDAILYRYILFNEKAEIIPLESEYNGIYQFSRYGLATVCTRKNFEIINNEKFRAEKKWD